MSRRATPILLAAVLAAGVAAVPAPQALATPATAPAPGAVPVPGPEPLPAPAVSRPGWSEPSYQPRHGRWRDYLLAPARREIRPQHVQLQRSRDGEITGRTRDLLRADGRTVRLTSIGDRAGSPLVVLDLGQEVSGPVKVAVADASAERPGLHVCYSESLRYLARSPGQNDGQTAVAPGCDTANIFNGFPGQAYTYDSDSHELPLAEADLPRTLVDPELRGGFRYVTLFLDGPGWVDLDAVSMRFTAARGQRLTDYPGHFLSSDHLLNKIWYAGAYTVQVNTDRPDTAKRWPYVEGEGDHADDVVPGADPGTDVIFDGGKRDRIVWQGDLAVQNPVAYLSTYDLPAVENSLTSLAGQQLEDGYVPAASQVGPHNAGELRTYGEYVTWFVANLAEHYRYTGDRGYLRRWWPAMREAMAWLESQRRLDDTGLIAMGPSGSCGHYGYRNCGHETYNNALYVGNARAMARLAAAAGEPGVAPRYRRLARRTTTAINEQLWDREVGAYRLSTELPGAYPQDGNTTAVLTGVADARQSRRALAYLRRTSWTDIGALTVSPQTPTSALLAFHAPLPSWFEVEARFAAPGATPLEQQAAYALTKRFWGWMLRRDPGTTFWEHVQPDGSPNLQQFSSLAHGWAAGPTVSLTEHALGVSPIDPGYGRFSVAPVPGSLRWAEGTVPTPHGTIRAAWRRDGADRVAIRVHAPRRTNPVVTVPIAGRRVEVTLDGRTVWRGTSRGARAVLRDGHVVVRSLGAGRHRVVVRRLAPVRAQARLALTPTTTVADPGDLVALDAVLTGRADGVLSGTLEATAPRGWALSRRQVPLRLASRGRTVERSVRLFVRVPEDAGTGSFPVSVRFRPERPGSAGAATSARADVRLEVTETLFDFEGGVQGWRPGQRVAGVATVSGFPNGPGRPFEGTAALEATAEPAPGEAERSVLVEPDEPIDLDDATTLLVRLDSYGGAPGATGYEAVVRLTGAGGEELAPTFAVQPDTWNTLEVDLAGWSPRAAVSRIEVGFRAPGGTVDWTARFQLDAIGWIG